MKLEKLTDIWGAGKWLLLGVVYFVLTLAYLPGRWELWFAIPYALGFLSVAIVLSAEQEKEQSEWKVNPVTALCATLIDLLSVYVSGYASHDGVSQTVAYTCICLFAILIAIETELLKFGKPSSSAKYLVILAFAAWAVWAFDYFRLRMVWQTGIPFETALNHGGIMLLAANEALKLLGIKYGVQKPGTSSLQDKLSVIFALAAVLGAFLLVAELGWGLGLIPLP